MDAGIWLGIIGLALTLGFGIGAWLQGRRSHAHIGAQHAQIDAQLVEIHRRIILGTPPGASKAGEMDFVAVDFADVNHDGANELLIQHWAGNHGTALRVLGWNEHEFEDLGYLGTATTQGFTVGDLDGDGRIEIATVDDDYEREIAPGKTASHADGVHVELLYRWEGEDFALVGRRELPLPWEGPRPEPIWHTDPLPLFPRPDSSADA